MHAKSRASSNGPAPARFGESIGRRGVNGGTIPDLESTPACRECYSSSGARAKVKRVEMLDVEPRELDGESGFVARARWNVIGSVGHWGHVHARTNRYEAELTIRTIDGNWKVTKLDILQEERL